MTYTEWIEQVEKIRMQYIEGAITAREFFNATLARACEVEQTPEETEFPDEVRDVR
jgi:hypothetical protein